MTRPCRCCGGERGTWADGARAEHCRRCYDRWREAGFPVSGPPAPRRAPGGWGIRAGRIEDYLELRSWGASRTEAARRLGVCMRTINRYESVLGQSPAPGTSTPGEHQDWRESRTCLSRPAASAA